MSTRKPHNNEVTPSLWSNNPQFVEVMTTYFEHLWNKTLDISGTLNEQKRKTETAADQKGLTRVEAN